MTFGTASLTGMLIKLGIFVGTGVVTDYIRASRYFTGSLKPLTKGTFPGNLA